MTEIVILPEMELAGMEALREGRKQGLDDAGQAVAVYMAMRMVWAIQLLANSETVH